MAPLSFAFPAVRAGLSFVALKGLGDVLSVDNSVGRQARRQTPIHAGCPKVLFATRLAREAQCCALGCSLSWRPPPDRLRP